MIPFFISLQWPIDLINSLDNTKCTVNIAIKQKLILTPLNTFECKHSLHQIDSTYIWAYLIGRNVTWLINSTVYLSQHHGKVLTLTLPPFPVTKQKCPQHRGFGNGDFGGHKVVQKIAYESFFEKYKYLREFYAEWFFQKINFILWVAIFSQYS